MASLKKSNLPLLTALSFIETTSEPAFASLIARAPIFSPDINCRNK